MSLTTGDVPFGTRESRTRRGFATIAHAAGKPELRVVIIPGFLSGGQAQQSEWRRSGEKLRISRSVEVSIAQWPSGRVLRIMNKTAKLHARLRWFAATPFGLAPALTLAVAFKAEWRTVVDEADDVSDALGQYIFEEEVPTVLIGHSLGGRIAMKAAEALAHNDTYAAAVIAMAPAIARSEVAWDRLDAGLAPVDVMYSDNDQMLRFMYRLGENTMSAPVGLVGPPKYATRARGRRIDKLGGKVIGHGDYCDNLHRLLSLTDSWRSVTERWADAEHRLPAGTGISHTDFARHGGVNTCPRCGIVYPVAQEYCFDCHVGL